MSDLIDWTLFLSKDCQVHIIHQLCSGKDRNAKDLLRLEQTCHRLRDLVVEKNMWAWWNHHFYSTLPEGQYIASDFNQEEQRIIDNLILPQDTDHTKYDPILNPYSLQSALPHCSKILKLYAFRFQIAVSIHTEPTHYAFHYSTGKIYTGRKMSHTLKLYLGPGIWPRFNLPFGSQNTGKLTVSSIYVIGVHRDKTILQSEGDNSSFHASLTRSGGFNLPVYVSNLTCVSKPLDAANDNNNDNNNDVRKFNHSFGIRATRNIDLHVDHVTIIKSRLSGIIIDRGATATISNCIIRDCGEHGVYVLKATADIQNCHIERCGRPSIAVCKIPHDEKDKSHINISNNCILSSKDRTGIYILMPGLIPYTIADGERIIVDYSTMRLLEVNISNNKIIGAWDGIYLSQEDTANKATGVGQDGIKLKKDELYYNRPCYVNILGNEIIHPSRAGIHLDRIGFDNNYQISNNKISGTRYMGINIFRPHQVAESCHLSVADNQLESTAESNGYSAGIQDLYDKSAREEVSTISLLTSSPTPHTKYCTKTVTGENFGLQEWYTCKQCNLTSKKNLGCCRNCALTCHKGHVGLILASYIEPAFCDCAH